MAFSVRPRVSARLNCGADSTLDMRLANVFECCLDAIQLANPHWYTLTAALLWQSHYTGYFLHHTHSETRAKSHYGIQKRLIVFTDDQVDTENGTK